MSVALPIERLAIVNRGEAAMRCVRAVKALRLEEGSTLEAIALYTDVDRDAPFVRQADSALRLHAPRGEVAAYLDHDLLLATLRQARADAVWPGWGFVAEDPVFADRVFAAGLRFVGPSGAAMRLLGDKIAAKRLAEQVGVPVSPWSGDAVADEAIAQECAERIGYPLVVKAAAGGGGRGIRVVKQPSGLLEALRSAGSEALSAFGDGRLFLERMITGGRHIEVQFARDSHGNVVTFGCRDCSVQRRHQKVIEEAPPPGLAQDLLAVLIGAATRLAAAVEYVGVGTVEFLVAGESCFFLEVNPRLQVEHGVTETLTGVDLVQLQIRIARDESIAAIAPVERGVAIEARVCAEDPAAGFLPSPGRVARFDVALGPRVRVDTGVVAGNAIPAAFDSLIAKVIASGDTREEARARLVSALTDFDLVIEGGATNKGYLIELLETPELRRGGVDTGWLDRSARAGSVGGHAFAAESLLAAAILAYQRRRRDARLNFYADTTNVALSRVPPSAGQEIELLHLGSRYQLRVFALGSWRYRVHLDGRAISVTLREGDAHIAVLTVAGRTLRVLHDETDLGVRIEVEGHAHRFGWQTVGEVRAATPAMVAAVHVAPGDAVVAGQALGLLEAMKMEIAFLAPVAGVVGAVRVRAGQQVAAGDVLLTIDPGDATNGVDPADSRLELPEEADPLELLFATEGDRMVRDRDLDAGPSPRDAGRSAALDALRAEMRGLLLGYDADPDRAAKLEAALDVPICADATEAECSELAEVAAEVVLFADVEQLFVRAPRLSEESRMEPSNDARLRTYLRRMRAGGAGMPEPFLNLLRTALGHYGIADLRHDDALERAVLRVFAAQLSVAPRRRVVRAILRRLGELARGGTRFDPDGELARALVRLAEMRDVVGDQLADAAIEASHVLFVEPAIVKQLGQTTARIETFLTAAREDAGGLAGDALLDLAEAPRKVFEHALRSLAAGDARGRAAALAACLHRFHASQALTLEPMSSDEDLALALLRRRDGRSVLGVYVPAAELPLILEKVRHVSSAISLASGGVDAVNVFVCGEPTSAAEAEALWRESAPASADVTAPVTLSWIAPDRVDSHWTFVPGAAGHRLDPGLHGLHPETAERLALARLGEFDLERLTSPEETYAFHGRSRTVSGDERIFVLAEMRGRSAQRGGDGAEHVAAFLRAFEEAARALRSALSTRDPERRLQWNRIAIVVVPDLCLDAATMHKVARQLAPATHRLGVERVIVRLALVDPQSPDVPAEQTELVVTNVTGQHLEISAREPKREPVLPATDYDRKVVEARRRRLIYPYEILRFLTGGDGADLPRSTFEEWDLAPGDGPARAVSVAGRAPGGNSSAVVFGVIRTVTEKVPEGMVRVIVLSDPTLSMGSLAAPECDRICAAIDLAERLRVPVEWIPISSGARIAMDSGTENLDATARVVKRIVTFTQQGGVIHLIVYGTNVGAQSYWNALAAMLMHTRGALIMTANAAMVLTGRKALEASGSVAAEDEVGIGGFEPIMGRNGEAQYYASDLLGAYRTLYEHYRFTYVVPGERGPRPFSTRDSIRRCATESAYPGANGQDFHTVGEIFDDRTNPGRKRPFAMRPIMRALIDEDGGHLERWASWVGAETAIVWDAHLGGRAVCLIGIESQSVERDGYRPLDGPSSWTGGTLFPLSSKKVARALNAASGMRPVVILANLSGFDGSPESMRKLQLEHGAEIARAVVNFSGPLIFLVVSRYHGGAYVVFSKALNEGLHAAALEGSYASVIGGGAAASVVLTREVRARAATSARVRAAKAALAADPSRQAREALERATEESLHEARTELAAEFDAIHSVARARQVGSLDDVVPPEEMRSHLIRRLALAD